MLKYCLFGGLTLVKVNTMVMSFDVSCSSLLLTPHAPVAMVPLGSKFISWYFYVRGKRRGNQITDQHLCIIWKTWIRASRTYLSLLETNPQAKVCQQAGAVVAGLDAVVASGGCGEGGGRGRDRGGGSRGGGRRVCDRSCSGCTGGVSGGGCRGRGCICFTGGDCEQTEGIGSSMETLETNAETSQAGGELRRCTSTYWFHSCCRYWQKPVWARSTASC